MRAASKIVEKIIVPALIAGIPVMMTAAGTLIADLLRQRANAST